MKIKHFHSCILILTGALAAGTPWDAPAQERAVRRKAWEIGPGGAFINNTRISVADFMVRSDGYQFNLEDKHLYGGLMLSLAHEIVPWLYWDIRATAGLVNQTGEDGKSRSGHSILAGPGLQFRPFPESKWVVPYARFGINYFQKDFVTRFFGDFNSDVTGTAQWTVVKDAWNNAPGDNEKNWFPLSAGVGVIGWMSNRIGIGLQGEYIHAPAVQGRNFAQGSIQLLIRLSGEDKRKAGKPVYLEKRVEVPVERIVEKPIEIERIVEKRIEVPAEKSLAELMENVHFAFDRDSLTGASEHILEKVASLIRQFPSTRFLIAGYTDARGSALYNEDLSTRRAKAVYDSLIAKGVNPKQLTYRGFGKRRAVVPAQASEKDREGDRKVVIETVTNPTLWNYLNKK